MFKSVPVLPRNFTLIYSFVGKQDQLIDVNLDRHAKVFEHANELGEYSNAANNDMVAALGHNNKIGLVYHGVKSFKNTQWGSL
jgi:hypothetical protein